MVSIMLPRADVAAQRLSEVLATEPTVRDPEDVYKRQVVAEKIADDADLTGGILSSAYAVRYLKTNYDLANRMYYKRAFDAGLTI